MQGGQAWVKIKAPIETGVQTIMIHGQLFSGCSLRLDKAINDSSSCTATGGIPNDTISVCYNATAPDVPIGIMNATLADEKGYASRLPSEEYLKYV